MNSDCLPDFIIGGSQKSGTSSMHHILEQHKDVFIPGGELHFFCMDDVISNPEFVGRSRKDWIEYDESLPDYEEHFERNLAWYQDFFASAKGEQVIGEDGAVYLSSQYAPARIADLLPNVKLIFLLRNPVDRTYSQYQHLLRTGRAVYDFEDTLQYGPHTLLSRSQYKVQIERYLEYFSRDQMKFIIFEEFITNMQEVVDEVCSFLGLASGIDLSQVETHRMSSPVPRWSRLLEWQNYLTRSLEPNRYAGYFPGTRERKLARWEKIASGVNRRLRNFNLRSNASKPPMAKETRGRLQRIMAKENEGLSELINIDLNIYWDIF